MVVYGDVSFVVERVVFVTVGQQSLTEWKGRRSSVRRVSLGYVFRKELPRAHGHLIIYS